MMLLIFPKEGPPTNYFALQRGLFKILGVSFSGNESRAYRIYSAVFLCCVISAYPLVQLSEAFKVFNNLTILSVILLYTSITLMGAVKTVLIFFNRKAMGKTLDMIEQGVFAPNLKLGGPIEIDMVKQCIILVNKQSLVYMGMVFCSMSSGVLDAIVRRIKSSDYHDWRFPLGYFSLFNVTYSPNYEIALFYQVFCATTCITTSMIGDVLVLGFLLHITTQCEMLQIRVRNMIKNACQLMMEDLSFKMNEEIDTIDPSKIPWKYLKVVLKDCVFYHTEIIAVSEVFEQQFNHISLLQFISSSIALCFSLYYSLLFPVTDAKFFHYVMVFICLSFEVFLFCHWGNEIALQSQAVADACSEVNFVGTDARFQKGLLLMIERSQRPIALTAGKFTMLSLNTFVNIMRASYSYYTVMTSR